MRYVNAVDRFFGLAERDTDIATEVRAGVATFLTMAYILFVNPQILSQAGMPPADVALATGVAAAAATLVMGLYANYPFALAPGMGLNAYFTFGVVQGMGVSYPVALGAVLIEGLLFLLLAFGGVRAAVVNAIPATLKTATTAGIGLFLAIIGFSSAGWVEASPATLVTLGDLTAPAALLAFGTLLVTAAMLVRGVQAAILIGIVAGTGAGWLIGLAEVPDQFVALPGLPKETFLAIEFEALFTAKMVPVVLAFLFVDFFDTAGTLVGVGRLGGFLDEKGNLPRADRAFTADAVGTSVGAVLGTSTVTSYIESATGIQEGGRTGLTAVTVAALFLASLFFTPLLSTVPASATAPALVIVGAMMMRAAGSVDWERFELAIPAFLTIVGMPFTYSIANGITLGIVSYVAIHLLAGRPRDIHPIMYLLALLLLLYHAGGLGA